MTFTDRLIQHQKCTLSAVKSLPWEVLLVYAFKVGQFFEIEMTGAEKL